MYKSFQDPVIGPMLLKRWPSERAVVLQRASSQNDHEAAVLRRECQPAEALGLQDRERLVDRTLIPDVCEPKDQKATAAEVVLIEEIFC